VTIPPGLIAPNKHAFSRHKLISFVMILKIQTTGSPSFLHHRKIIQYSSLHRNQPIRTALTFAVAAENFSANSFRQHKPLKSRQKQ